MIPVPGSHVQQISPVSLSMVRDSALPIGGPMRTPWVVVQQWVYSKSRRTRQPEMPIAGTPPAEQPLVVAVQALRWGSAASGGQAAAATGGSSTTGDVSIVSGGDEDKGGDDSSGCACDANESPASPLTWVMLGLIGLFRMRRRR